jgi:hypothetical protein
MSNNNHKGAFHKLGLLMEQEQAWMALEEYLLEQTQQMTQALVAETSVSEIHRLQGKLALLGTLLKLRNNYRDMQTNRK